jgi:hypothetical protein
MYLRQRNQQRQSRSQHAGPVSTHGIHRPRPVAAQAGGGEVRPGGGDGANRRQNRSRHAVGEASRTSRPGAFYARDQNAARTHLVLRDKAAQGLWAAPIAPAENGADELLLGDGTAPVSPPQPFLASKECSSSPRPRQRSCRQPRYP